MNDGLSLSPQNITQKHTVALFIPSLGIGGAERQLLELAKGIDRTHWNVYIVTMYDNLPSIANSSQLEDIRMISLGKNENKTFFFRLLNFLSREQVDILHVFLPSAQFYAALGKLFRRRVKLVFSVRDSYSLLEVRGTKDIIINLVVFGAGFLIRKYVFNSFSGLKNKRSFFVSRKATVIPNGIDTKRYYPRDRREHSFRHTLGLSDKHVVVGILANINPDKDYSTLIHSAKKVVDTMSHVHFVSIGDDLNNLGFEMKALVKELSLEDHFHFLGLCTDTEIILPCLDIVCSSSSTEGFSNSICEAMACGLPCVVTDVGDSAFIVGKTGLVVPPGDPGKLAEGILFLLRLSHEERVMMGRAARQRIIEHFPLSSMVSEYEKVYASVMRGSLSMGSLAH